MDQIFVDDKVRDYIVDLVHATRDPAAAGIAELDGHDRERREPARFDLPDEGRQGARLPAGSQLRDAARREEHRADVLRHRVILTYEAEAEGKTPDDIIERILVGILVP